METPLPLPPYEFDAALSTDDNYLAWACILARHSNSRKGHMGAIIVNPTTSQILSYANNTPLLFNASLIQKKIQEIHAEALCVSQAASIQLHSLCFMLLAAAGVKRIVHLNKYCPPVVAVSAKALGIEIRSVDFALDVNFNDRSRQFWASQGETAEMTRSRVDRWWDRWMQRIRTAADALGVKYDEDGGGRKKRKRDDGSQEKDGADEDVDEQEKEDAS
ncbi:hypothetical protein BCR33DRAFT_714998, partial [Rhizoclosmatium globosum]